MKKSVLLIFATCFIIAVMCFFYFAPSENEPISVIATKVQTKNISDYVKAKGRVVEGKKQGVYIDKTARVKNVNVKTGDKVKKGDLLFEIEAVEIPSEEIKQVFNTDGITDVFEKYGIEIDLGNSTKSVLSTVGAAVYSPIDGTVTDVNVEKDSIITSVNKLASISDFSELYIQVLVPESYSLKVSSGQRAEINGEAFGEKSYYGEIMQISPTAKYIPKLTGDGETYTEASVSIENIDKHLLPGLSVTARIAINTVAGALAVPYECVFQDENNSEAVFVVSDGKAEKRLISTGYELEEFLHITSGIEREDVVIFNPSEELFDGASVTVAEWK